MKPLAILFATSEMAPWVKTGGLGDVAAALPAALHRAGHDIRVLLPAYPALKKAFPTAPAVAEIPALAPGLPACRLLAAQDGGLPLLLLDCPALFDRPGNPYLDANARTGPTMPSVSGCCRVLPPCSARPPRRSPGRRCRSLQ